MYIRRTLSLLAFGLLVYIVSVLFSGGRHNEHSHLQTFPRFYDFSVRDQTWPGWAGINHIFAFGDSHTETGFDIDGVQPNEQNPFGNPDWPGSTTNTSLNWLGHLTATFNQSFIKTYNFAKSGSPIEGKGGKDSDSAPPSLGQQIDTLFLPKHGSSEGTNRFMRSSLSGWTPQDSLFVFYVGVDDMVSSFHDRGGEASDNEVEMHMKQYLFNLKKIYSHGARNMMIITIPALEESPAMRSSPVIQSMFNMGAQIVDFNGRIAFMAHQFAEAFSDANVFLFDNLHFTVGVRDNPQKHAETQGLKEMEGYCVSSKAGDLKTREAGKKTEVDCGQERDRWYWRDKTRTTEPAQRLQARLMVEQMSLPHGGMLPYEFW